MKSAKKKENPNKNSQQKAVVKKENKILPWLLPALAMLLLLIIRFRLLNIPFERDEGEFGYIAQLILGGNSFLDAYNYKIPGVSFAYAPFIMLFGSTTAAVKLSLLVFNLATVVFLFLLLKKFFDSFWAGISCLLFVLLITDSAVLGNAAHATQFLNFGFIASLFYAFAAFEKPEKPIKLWFFSGLFMGIALIMKQNALLLMPIPVVLYLFQYFKSLLKEWKKHLLNLIAYGGAFLIPVSIIALISLSRGELGKFWNWTYVYPKSYASVLKLSDGFILFKINFATITSNYWFLWLIAAVGLILLIMDKKVGSFKKTAVIVMLFFSAISIVPGFYFRSHYFVILLPVISILAAFTFYKIRNTIAASTKEPVANGITLSIVALLCIYFLNDNKDYLFKKPVNQLARTIYGTNPFLEGYKIGKYIRENSSDTDKVAVLGSEAEIYYYSQRKAATGYLFMYDMVNSNPHNLEMQKQMISEIEQNKPMYMVFANTATSWLMQEGAPDTLFKWFNNYVRNYSLIYIADIFSNITYDKWFAEAQNYKPQSPSYMMLFRRNDVKYQQ